MKELNKKKQVTLLAGLLLAIFSLPACYAENAGTFKATMGDKKIEVAIKCHNFDNDKFDTEFIFASDDGTAINDNDGDGLVVRGDRVNLSKPMKMDGIGLLIVDHGVEYETIPTSLGEFSKTDKGVSGTTKLYKADGMGVGAAVIYEVICK